MSKTTEAAKSASNAINTVKCLVDRYPVLEQVGGILFGQGGSLNLILILLQSLGVTQDELISLMAKWLGGAQTNGEVKKQQGGILDTIETSIKSILLLNLQNLFNCTIEPVIPDRLFKVYDAGGAMKVNGTGIELSLDVIDLFGVLDYCPVYNQSESGKTVNGSVFYFDTQSNTSEVWKSMDFNAFLWSIMHRGSNTWDNRYNFYKFNTDTYNDNKKNFFEANSGDNVEVIKNNKKVSFKKKKIIDCEYATRTTSNFATNILKVYVNAEEYYNKYSSQEIGQMIQSLVSTNSTETTDNVVVRPPDMSNITAVGRKFNKTIFEFNYDYIYSLKLFDSKILVANIINSVMQTLMGVSMIGTIDPRKQFIAGMVGEIIDSYEMAEDTIISDDFFSFSNEKYNELLKAGRNRYNGKYNLDIDATNYDFSDIIESISNLDSITGDLNEQETAIANIIKNVSVKLAQNPSGEDGYDFNFATDIVKLFIKETIVNITLIALSPKVAVLYAINNAVMGDATAIFSPTEYFQFITKNMKNLITQISKSILELFLKKLMDFVNEKLKPLLKQFAEKVALEQVIVYTSLIEQVISTCGSALKSLISQGELSTVIDNVNYADIITENTIK